MKLNPGIYVRNEGERYVFFNPATRGLHFVSKGAHELVMMRLKMGFDEVVKPLSQGKTPDQIKKFEGNLGEFYEGLIKRGVLVE